MVGKLPTKPRVIGVIPARAGSTRIPDKNIRLLGGRPLISWTIEAAREAHCLDQVIVSTDSEDIAEIARGWGAEVPWLRSTANATSTANVVDAVLEVLERLLLSGAQTPDAVMLLQPTSPFRTSASIGRALEAFVLGSGRSVVSVRPTKDHPAWNRRLDAAGHLRPVEWQCEPDARPQDLATVYTLNGAIYVATTATLRTRRSFYSTQTIGFVMRSQIEGLDIDTLEDWVLAEACLSSLDLRQERMS